MPLRLGWRKDKFDPRNYLHKIAKVVPNVVDWSAIIPNVRDQGNLGSCTGFGIGGQLTALANKLKVYTEWFSPTWIYNGARYIEGTLTQDAGAAPGDCFDWLKQKGCLLEHFWPYTGILDKTSPPSKFNVEAAKYPEIIYTRVTGDVDGICSALAAGNIVSIGTPWFDSWMNIGADGILPTVSDLDTVAGGHETYLYGYDKTQNLFFGSNSWGTSWGKAGRYLMPFSAFPIFKTQGGYDAQYVTVNWRAIPPAPPPPSPAPSPAPAPVVATRIRLQESKDVGKSWKTLYDNNV
jgi:hypothetical protein